MLVEIQKRRCRCCGREFTYHLGGFILRAPKCPHCGHSGYDVLLNIKKVVGR